MVLLKSEVVLKAGSSAPDFNLLGVDGKRHSLSDYTNYDGLLVIFICNHCPYVKAKVDAIKPEDTATEKTMIKNIEKFLAGQKIEKDFDPSIGCSIKWKEQT